MMRNHLFKYFLNQNFFKESIIILLISFWPIVHFISINVGENIISFNVIYFGLLVFLLSFFSYLFLKLFFEKHSVFVFLNTFIMIFFMFGGIESYVINLRSTVEYSAKISIFVQFILFIIFSQMLIKICKKKENLNIFLFLILIFYSSPVFSIVKNIKSVPEFRKNEVNIPIDNFNNRKNHNIYYIILDQYARQDVLRKHLNYDNDYFIKELKEMGFIIFNNSFSNYNTTPLTISTSLNMDYYTYNRDYDVSLIQNESPAVKNLKKIGYKNIFIESGGNSQITCNGLEDFCIKGGAFHDDIALLVKMTPFWRLMKNEHFFRYFEALYLLTDLNLSIKSALEFHKQSDSNFFLFAHILSPHEPQRYNKDCSKYTSLNPGLGSTTIEQYTTDLPCLNQTVIETLEYIYKIDKTDPIIIIQSDHGISNKMVASDDKIIRLKNLMAFKTPKECEKYLEYQFSPVNNMHFVFSCLFKKKPIYLEDKYFLDLGRKQFLLEDVTSIVNSERETLNK